MLVHLNAILVEEQWLSNELRLLFVLILAEWANQGLVFLLTERTDLSERSTVAAG